MHACLHTCWHEAYSHTDFDICMHVYIHADMRRICIPILMHIHKCRRHIHTYIHTYIHTWRFTIRYTLHTWTYMHTHVHRQTLHICEGINWSYMRQADHSETYMYVWQTCLSYIQMNHTSMQTCKHVHRCMYVRSYRLDLFFKKNQTPIPPLWVPNPDWDPPPNPNISAAPTNHCQSFVSWC
jgi:hypothetical protein